MSDEFNQKLCDERTKNTNVHIAEIKKQIAAIFTRLNWFYIIAILTLAGIIATFFKVG